MNEPTSTSQASDEELVKAIRAGDQTAERELDRRWRPRLLGEARAILDKHDLAEDAAQEALWRGFLHLDRYDDSRAFEPWILKVAGNLARDHLRKRKRRPPIEGAS